MIKIRNKILLLPRKFKKIILIICDLLIINFLFHTFNYYFNLSISNINIFIINFLLVAFLYILGIYNNVLRYSLSYTFIDISKKITFFYLLYFLILLNFSLFDFLLFIFIALLSLFSLRIILYYIFIFKIKKNIYKKNLIIFGFSKESIKFYELLKNSSDYNFIGFIDDDISICTGTYCGYKIFHSSILSSLKDQISFDYIVLPKNFNNDKILNILRNQNIKIIKMPDLNDILKISFNPNSLLNFNFSDLLERSEVTIDSSFDYSKFRNKVICITGAGGSIGSEICKQLINFKPQILLLVDNNEFSLFNITNSINKISNQINCIPLLINVQDINATESIFTKYRPDIIFHCAAYKHVTLVENNPLEAIKNNVFGTFNLANLALKYNIKDFVLISSDKAVRPTNIMGATKRLSELIIQGYSSIPKVKTKYSAVRFGNVLGSSGSVVPKFLEQIKSGGPVTVSDKNVVRFFMTIPEAVNLVILACTFSDGGELYVLDMGKPVRINDLAIKMISLFGLTIKNEFNVDGDIEIKYTGLQPGEKLFEELFIDDNYTQTYHPRILVASDNYISYRKLRRYLNLIHYLVNSNNLLLINKLLRKITFYH